MDLEPQRDALQPELDMRPESTSMPSGSLDLDAESDQKLEACPATPRQNWQGVKNVFGLVAISALVVGGFLATLGSPVPSGAEKDHANWTHVEAVNSQINDSSQSVIRHVSRAGVATFASDVVFGAKDEDTNTTQRVKEAIQNGDLATAALAIKEAQVVPDSLPVEQEPEEEKVEISTPEPKISTGMQQQILSGDTKFFHIYLYDCCDEDGDVVDVVIDGEVFARVPITHAGATLSVPVGGQGTTISLRGVRDGMGGITVACRTSQGDFFTKSMLVNETQTIGFVR